MSVVSEGTKLICQLYQKVPNFAFKERATNSYVIVNMKTFLILYVGKACRTVFFLTKCLMLSGYDRNFTVVLASGIRATC